MEDSQNNNENKNTVNNNDSYLQRKEEENEEYNHGEAENEELEEEIEEEIEPSKEIELLYESLLEFYSKKQYKKILKTIILKADKDEKFNLLEWKLLHLRTSTLQKILEKKISYYYKSSKIPHFSEYIQKINNDINNWLSFTQELKNQNEIIFIDSFVELIIFFLLQNVITLSKNYIYSGHIKDAIGILSLGIGLFNKGFYFIKSPDSYCLGGEIFLSLSSFMIAEENFNTAKTFISICIKFCFLSLEIKLFKNGNNYKLFNLMDYKNELSHFSKIFFNLSVAFYQLGICYEHESDSYNAFYAVKTSKIFGEIIENEDFELFVDLVKDIETRLLMRNRIILFFEKNVKKEEIEEKTRQIKKEYNKLFDQEEKKRQKFRRIKKYIENLKLIDIDDEEPDLFNKVGCKPMNENVLKTTKQMHLLNCLMSNDFKELVIKMNKLEINKLEKDTINKIQKKIIALKNNERAKLEEKAKNELAQKKKFEEIKKQIKEMTKEKEEKLLLIKSHNKSNTIKSTSVSLTTANTRKPRINSAYKSMNRKYLLTNNNENQSNKTLKTFIDNPNSDSLFTSPSRFLSITENFPSNKRRKIFSRDRILNKKQSITLSQKFQDIRNDRRNIKTNKKPQKNIFKYTPKYIHKYNYNNYYFNKKFKKKYNFLENQYDKEIEFQKQLLKTKFIKDESLKPESFNIRDIHKKVEDFYYTTYENELMNAKEKQIIFDKTELMNTNRLKTTRRLFSAETKIFSLSNLHKEKEFLNNNQIQENNNDCINDITNKILKISSQEKEITIKKRKIKKNKF